MDQQPSQPSESAQDANAPDPLIGKIIGKNFRVVKLIGSGAMGNVYQAEQRSLGKMVALKLLHHELMGDEQVIRRFELEAKSASSLNHPNSIQIIDFGRDGDLLYIAMELLPGRDLAQVIKQEWPLSLDRVVRIMDQVLSALDEAHTHGIVHRDLKPSNIMLVSRRGEPDSVKVCDFGIAKVQSSREGPMLTVKGVVFGTPEYMSPEQARGDEVDGRADLYAAAIIFYQLLTGDLPFSDTSPVGLMAKHLFEPAQVPSLKRPELNIPAAIESLVMQGMEKEPSERPQSAVAFREQLRAAYSVTVDTWPAASNASSEPGPVPAVVNPPTRSWRPWLVSGSIAVAAVAGALFVVVALPSGRKSDLLREGVVPMLLPFAETSHERAPAPSAVAPEPIVEPLAPAPAGSEQTSSPAAPAPSRGAAKRGKSSAPKERATSVAAKRSIPERQPTSSAPSVTPSPTQIPTAPASVTPPPPVVNAREIMQEAERLLGQGEVERACRRGEEAKQAGPQISSSYKFLGKCYMRAGDPQRAKDNYRKYLELAPNASDAAFIQSMIK